jgi:hypothetical protein
VVWRRVVLHNGAHSSVRWCSDRQLENVCGTSTFDKAARSWKLRCVRLDLDGWDRLGERQRQLLIRLVWQLAAGYGG